MNIERVQKQLEIDEGVVYEVYNDHLGYPTFGIGHLIRKEDPEFGEPVGTPISKERVADAFAADISIACGECEVLYDFWEQCRRSKLPTLQCRKSRKCRLSYRACNSRLGQDRRSYSIT